MDKNPKYTLVEEDDEFGGRKRYRLQENDNKEK